MLKQFVEEQHALHDAEAKAIAQHFWIKLGYTCVENPDQYGVDLLVEGKGRKFGCEVETKTGWHGPRFEFPTLRIPFRKQSSQMIVSPSLFSIRGAPMPLWLVVRSS